MVSNTHRAMALAYRLVGVALLPPSKSRLILEKGDIIKDLKERVNNLGLDEHPKIRDSLRQAVLLADGIGECVENDECWTGFSVEVTGLTVTSFKRLKCPPFESIYTSKGPRVVEAPGVASSLKRYYSLLGLEADKDMVIAVDHVSVELEFLAALHDAEASVYEGLVEGVNPFDVAEIRKGFLEDHVSRWIPSFTRCLRDNTGNKLVRNVADSIEALLGAEKYV